MNKKQLKQFLIDLNKADYMGGLVDQRQGI